MSHETEIQGGGIGYQPKINDVAQNFLVDLQKERSRLTEDFPLCALLIDEAFDRVYSTGRIPGREFYADVLKQKPMKLTQKVFVPVKQYPKFNFTGKILGPKGNSLIRLQDETQCKITIKGRNSMRDKVKEEELRKSDDPRFSHLNKDLFVEISTVATPAECYARIAYVLAEIRKYLIPDKNDEVSHEQLRETMDIDPEMAKAGYGGKPEIYKTVFDKTGGSKGTRKYLEFLKHTSNAEREELEDEYEYEHISHGPPPKRPSNSSGYEYIKVPSSSKGYKRAVPMYTDTKRVREVSSSKPYKNRL
ncbi:KH domain-containing, RNA-binding, signal transduction-associated protein 2-like isoform X1 [Calliphora vicina]|uniref:KH domain-containing, RNA-binding, signal transduction-associated protein 2-like isoform X1 n=1 Tax=Calliphora vicina TaxID=7373 RepID=UPI00325AB172